MWHSSSRACCCFRVSFYHQMFTVRHLFYWKSKFL
jgi:hypothetical protein